MSFGDAGPFFYIFKFSYFSSFCALQKQAVAGVCVTMETVKEALDRLRGAVMIVYPMGLPPHDPIRMELDDQEDLSGTQVGKQQASSWVVTSPLDGFLIETI